MKKQRRNSRKPKNSPAMAGKKTPTQQDVVSDDLNYELLARTVKARLVEKELLDVVENGIPPGPSEYLSKWIDFAAKVTEGIQILQYSLPDTLRKKTLETTTSAKHLWDWLKEANEEQSKKKLEQVRRIEEDGEERIIPSASFMDRVKKIAADPRSESNHQYLAITNMVLLVSDSYDITTDELIVMGQKKLTFKNFRRFLVQIESKTVNRTLYEVLRRNESRSLNCEGFIRWITSMSDSYDGAALVMDQVVGVKNLTFNTTRELLDAFESVPAVTIKGIMKGFVVGSSSRVKEVCYSPSDLRGLLKEAELEMKEGEGNSSASSDRESKSVMRSRHERGECIQCGGKGHVFKDCSNNRKNQSRNDEAVNVVGPVTFEKDMWMLYTTTTNHMTPYIKYFTYLDRTHRVRIKSITGHPVISEGRGDVRIMTKEGKKKIIKDVLFVPKIDRNVLSVGQLTDAGYRVGMTTDECVITEQKTGRLFGHSLLEERGYFLRLQVVEGNLTYNC